jgi:beta-glucosidase
VRTAAGPCAALRRVTLAPGERAELSLDGGPAPAVLAPDAPTPGPYDCTTLGADLAAEGVHDVRITLRGPLRPAAARARRLLRFSG